MFFAKDKWISLDKPAHLVGCIILTVVFDWRISAGFGIWKELPGIGNTGFSYKDLTADAIGICIGLLIRNGLGIQS